MSYCLPARSVCAVARHPCLTGSQCLTLRVPCQALFAVSDLCVCRCMSCLTGSQCAAVYDVCALFITIGSIVLCYCPCAGSLVRVLVRVPCVPALVLCTSAGCMVCLSWCVPGACACVWLSWCVVPWCGSLVCLSLVPLFFFAVQMNNGSKSVRTVRRMCHGLPLRVGFL